MIRHPRILPAAVFLLIAALAVVPGLLLGLENIIWAVDGVLLMAARAEFPFLLLAGFVLIYFLRFQIVAGSCALAQVALVLVTGGGAVATHDNPANVLWLAVFSLGAFLPALALVQILITVFRPTKSREG